jgi:hypothetical protein
MTTFHVVQYPTRPDATAENTRLVRAVYDELAQRRPARFRYATLLLGEDEFLHLAVSDAGPAPLPDLPAFQAFQRDLASRLTAPPRRSEARIIGNHRLL